MQFPSNPVAGQVVSSVAQSFIYQNGGWVSQPVLPSGLAQDASLQSILAAATTPPLPVNAAKDSSLQSILAAVQATINLSGTVWFDSTVVPPVYYVRRESINEETGIVSIGWETPAGGIATPTIANLVSVSNAKNIANSTQTFTATGTGTGYAVGDVLIHTFGVDTASSPATLAYSLWLNAGPSVSGTIISAPTVGTYVQSTQSVSASALPLPSGAATSALQPAINADGGSLAHIANWPTTTAVTGTFYQATQPISASALPLPSGAATSANQVANVTAAGTTATSAQAIQGVAGGLAVPVSGTINQTLATTGYSRLSDGTNVAAVKAASTAAATTDAAVVVSHSPNSPLPAGTNMLGSVSTTKAVGSASLAVAQVPITVAAQIVSARTGAAGVGRISVTLFNTGASTVFYGPAVSVSVSNGAFLPAGASVTLDTAAAVYGVSASGSNIISVTETF